MGSADLEAIKQLIRELSTEQLREINGYVVELLRDAFARKAQEAVGQFRRGDLVWFTARSGKRINGTVDRLNSKTVGVVGIGDAFGSWRVPPTMLHKLESKAAEGKSGLVQRDPPTLAAVKGGGK